MRVRQRSRRNRQMAGIALTLTSFTLLTHQAFGQAGAAAGGNTANGAAGAAGNTTASATAPGNATNGTAGTTAGQLGAPGQPAGDNTSATGAGTAVNAGTPTSSDLISSPPSAMGSQPAAEGATSQGNTNQAPGQTTGQGSVINATPKTVWNLASATEASLRSSSSLVIAQRTAEIDRKRADEQAAAAKPNVNAAASATRYDQATKIAIGGGPPVEVQKDHSEVLSINLANKIDLTGQVRTAVNQAKLQSEADEYQVKQIRNERILRTRSIYYNLLRARHQVQVAEASLRDALLQQTTAVNLNAGGVGQKIDVLRANTQVATAQQNRFQALNAEGIAQANFNDLVGQPLNTPVFLEDIPGAVVGNTVVPSPAVGAPAETQPLFQAPVAEVNAIDVNSSLATAIATRPEILAAETLVRANSLGIKLAHAALEPSLQLSAAGNYFPTTSFQMPRQRTAEITASIVLPLYDGGATRARVAQAKLREENAQTSLESRKADVALDVRQSYLNLLTAANQITAANSALEQAIAARQLAQIRYEGQVGLYLEVTDAEAALVAAQNSQVNAVYNYLIARAQFYNALGTPENS